LLTKLPTEKPPILGLFLLFIITVFIGYSKTLLSFLSLLTRVVYFAAGTANSTPRINTTALIPHMVSAEADEAFGINVTAVRPNIRRTAQA
jgi:membrane glycosyltransferase